MQWLIIILFGILGGVLGGMGMGGGTLLIPLLTLGLGILQQNAQAINLIAFLPMSLIALIIHSKNKLVMFKLGLPIAITGVCSSVLGAYFAGILSSDGLSVWFGMFLIAVGLFQMLSLWIFPKKCKYTRILPAKSKNNAKNN